jgi:hypothetical protein
MIPVADVRANPTTVPKFLATVTTELAATTS